jgi:hypothetical protein
MDAVALFRVTHDQKEFEAGNLFLYPDHLGIYVVDEEMVGEITTNLLNDLVKYTEGTLCFIGVFGVDDELPLNATSDVCDEVEFVAIHDGKVQDYLGDFLEHREANLMAVDVGAEAPGPVADEPSVLGLALLLSRDLKKEGNMLARPIGKGQYVVSESADTSWVGYIRNGECTIPIFGSPGGTSRKRKRPRRPSKIGGDVHHPGVDRDAADLGHAHLLFSYRKGK